VINEQVIVSYVDRQSVKRPRIDRAQFYELNPRFGFKVAQFLITFSKGCWEVEDHLMNRPLYPSLEDLI
jgi:hypothetical protein